MPEFIIYVDIISMYINVCDLNELTKYISISLKLKTATYKTSRIDIAVTHIDLWTPVCGVQSSHDVPRIH